jgi:hypothetical protein
VRRRRMGEWFRASIRLIAAGIAAFRATYTTAADTVARASCNGVANMLVVGLGNIRHFDG